LKKDLHRDLEPIVVPPWFMIIVRGDIIHSGGPGSMNQYAARLHMYIIRFGIAGPDSISARRAYANYNRNNAATDAPSNRPTTRHGMYNTNQEMEEEQEDVSMKETTAVDLTSNLLDDELEEGDQIYAHMDVDSV